jgi:hypothetical protein
MEISHYQRLALALSIAKLLMNSHSSTSSTATAALAFSLSYSSTIQTIRPVKHSIMQLGYRKHSHPDIDVLSSTMKSSDVSLSSSVASSDVALPSSPQTLRRLEDTSATTTTTTVINLNPFEEKAMALESSINTLTWFTGDVHEAEQVIRPRIQDVLRSNPWLLGSLRGSSPMRLGDNANIIEPTASDIDKVFQVFSFDDEWMEEKLKYGMAQQDNMRIAHKYGFILEQSNRLVNTNKALFKVSLIEESENRFALVGE